MRESKPVMKTVTKAEARQRAARGRVMTTLREMQATANVAPEEAEELAREAVEAVRAANRS